mmetsp:Transcript_3708/g.23235  ORF Transcript_3708/g.23235 Transcript_3708/m.23235 type:complete len:107 (+) Transcript_3708:98-418(+)
MESQDNIQLLLAAEKEGQEIVNKARSEKTQRLRQAKEEAEREIAHYRAHREEKYKKMLEEQTGNSGSTNEALNAQVDEELKSMNAVVEERMPKVVDFLYERITTIE